MILMYGQITLRLHSRPMAVFLWRCN